jgi:polysaccharide deacetylase family protein (PEP-CTERM system associated)
MIAAQGHEIASHGYGHRLVYDLTPEQFRSDLQRARDAIMAACGHVAVGYRAPSYSITARSIWALDVLIEEGYSYDASIYPIYHDRYGIPSAPRQIHLIRREAGAIWEIPGSTVRLGGVNLPVGGGGYFRLMPYAWTQWGLRRINAVERQPVIFYLHPWEIDPRQPRVDAPAATRLRHYANLHRTERRLRRLLDDFAFGPVRAVLSARLRPDEPFAGPTSSSVVPARHLYGQQEVSIDTLDAAHS